MSTAPATTIVIAVRYGIALSQIDIILADQQVAHESEMAANVERDFFGGSIGLHVLNQATKVEVFGHGLMDKLQHARRQGCAIAFPI